MSKKNKRRSGLKKFSLIAIFSIAITLFLSFHVANLLFGVNSYEVYSSLKDERVRLKHEIKRLQQENAYLQKEYFELKNLEPDQ